MIIACPKAFAGTENDMEREFLRAYLVEVSGREKVMLADRVWDAFKCKQREKFPKLAENNISDMRGSFEPENSDLDENNDEINPKDCSYDEMVKETNSLVDRKWAEIDIFLCEEREKYSASEKVKTINLKDFLLECMSKSELREFMKDFFSRYANEKYK